MKIKHTLKAGNHLALANNCLIESFRVEVKALSRLGMPIIRMGYIALTSARVPARSRMVGKFPLFMLSWLPVGGQNSQQRDRRSRFD